MEPTTPLTIPDVPDTPADSERSYRAATAGVLVPIQGKSCLVSVMTGLEP